MMEATVDTRYLSAGTNRYAAAADWSHDGLIAFGADDNVCLWSPAETRGIKTILSGHTAHVRAVKFLPERLGEKLTYLVTGGDDRGLRIWALDVEAGTASCVQTLQEHTAPINCIATLKVQPAGDSERRIFVSGAADAMVKVWSMDNAGHVTVVQSIRTSTKYLPLALALGPLDDDGNALIMAVAGTTSVVQIFTATAGGDSTSGLDFSLQATLSGHENWIRSLDFVREKPDQPGSNLLLASASQDKYIRLWRFHQGTALSALSAAGVNMAVDAMTPGNKVHKLSAGGKKYCVMFEALLLGHEDWIYSARWSRAADGRLQLLSASADNSLSIWESDEESGIWITAARLGEVSREKGATTATGSTGGFWMGLWSPDGTTVVTLGRTGSWRRWDYDVSEDQWKQNFAVSGHTRAVTGISWSRDGVYLLSTSSDQTTRLHAEWAPANGSTRTWHEMSRPQIHGYDLNCIDSLGPSSFVSGADEKLMRVFTEPKAVARMLNHLTGATTSANPTTAAEEIRLATLPDAANMPVLGLSNKAIDVVDDDADLSSLPGQPAHPGDYRNVARDALDPASMVRWSALDIDHPPFEESLSRHTLWPEAEKLYGHGYEISCLAASRSGGLVASACRASSLNHAVIRLFETRGWTELRPPLAAHTLTVTRLRFGGADDQFLLSVGRDRQWAVFERDGKKEGAGYKLLQANSKGHSRMILDAAWAPQTAEGVNLFATAGRDKQVKIWVWRAAREGKAEFVLAQTLGQEHPVTALDFLPAPTADGRLLLTIGTEAGKLVVLALSVDEGNVAVAETISVKSELWLPKAVLQLAWRPLRDYDVQEECGRELALAGEDGSLRIYSFSV
ncbi:WD40-repeat-containing domain protein [Lasiosphaeris hirsuta]|uniref:Elongator complex protein 2 n=1 Tax=Lasiosphaeris hirsuta TaxID=260670 RepID=A0AA40DYY6_9PEZI|nr:WD40-repeat-containing domain protein [Lasiosphaeris hirsuta]